MKSCHGPLISLTAFLTVASSVLLGQSTPTTCADTASGIGGTMAALRPTEVLLSITSPRAGENVVESMPNEIVTVSVDYWGPRLVSTRNTHKIDDYHLVFFLDVDATPYVGSTSPTPRCNPSVIHSDVTRVSFSHVMLGSHTLAIMLVGGNDVSVNPPVAASTSFVVKDGM